MNRAVDMHSGGALLDGLICFPPRRVVGFGGFRLCHDLFLYDLTTGVNQNHGSDPMDKIQLSQGQSHVTLPDLK
jgi:hypothetical protein